MTTPMTPEHFAEIKARNTWCSQHDPDNWMPVHQDRAALIAEVERLRAESDNQIDEVASALVALQSAPRPQPGSAGYRRWCQWYDGARADALK